MPLPKHSKKPAQDPYEELVDGPVLPASPVDEPEEVDEPDLGLPSLEDDGYDNDSDDISDLDLEDIDSSSEHDTLLSEDDADEPEQPEPSRPRASRPSAPQARPARRVKRSEPEPEYDERIDAVAPEDEPDDDYEELNRQAIAQNKRKAAAKRKEIEQGLEENEKKDNRKTRNSRKNKIHKTQDGADGKKDNLKKAKIVRISALTMLAVLILVGIFNAVVPKKTLTADDVRDIASPLVGDTGFPTQQAQGVVQQFMQAYLMLGSDAASSEVLDVFYNGKSTTGASPDSVDLNNTTINGNVTQRIEYGPYVYDSKALSAYSGDFTVGAVVYQVDTTTGAPIKDNATGQIKYKWLWFDVGAFYNPKTGAISIAKNSPILVPAVKTMKPSEIPDYSLPGDKEENKTLETEAMQQTLSDYMDAWAASKDSTLSTLTTPDRTPEAAKGMGGLVTRDGDIEYAVYGSNNGDGLYRVLVTVSWIDNIANPSAASSISYQSRYVVYVKPITNGKFLIKDIQPYKYFVTKTTN